ncbi:LamG-like jellyroll fold domain-containing protein [Flavobacterium sp.]|uniref:LamG-like jellyroll fold domain-containing protein n=1 Tax=Flavobacterium sp. TaxID=239 RepID=UPI0039E34631
MKTFTQNLLFTIAMLWITVSVSAANKPPLEIENPNAKQSLVLNGLNQYADVPQMLGGLSQATLMGWIRINADLTATSFIMGQDNFNLKIVADANGKTLVATAKNHSIAFDQALSADRWYHICVVYNQSATEKLKLYVNGRQEAAAAPNVLTGALSASAAKFTMGKNPLSNTDYFKGAMDEVRVFNTALTDAMIQKMVYQEIKPNGTRIRGEVVPRDIEGTNWSSLLAYFRMDVSADDKLFNRASTAQAQLYNAPVFETQMAPMPFETSAAGRIDAVVGQNNFVNGRDLSTYNWSIIQVHHNINIPSNQINLGMIIDPEVSVNLTNDNKLENTWYLKLDGKLDLKGKSQLVQTIDSELDPTSAGYIERDQQGQSNLYNYNYWCSPVGNTNTSSNNNSYSVNSILRDATNPDNLLNINWTNDLNGAPTSPITLSGFWIFKFQNTTPIYANWTAVGPNGTLLPAQGFTLKGCGASTPKQNFAFVGKPNNGTITSPIAAGNLNLSGNPYPSALDANAFIMANNSVINGSLYFWEHFSTNNSHNLADYQGGYAVRNLVGGTAPVSPVGTSMTAASKKIPGRFIPVGQAFFVNANTVGGSLTFNNDQRAFMKEDATHSNVLFKNGTDPISEQYDNSNDPVEDDNFARIRLGFNAGSFHRQVLLGFMNEFATSGMDMGYDAHNIDTQPNDLYLMNLNYKLIIEGEGYFNANNIYRLGVKTLGVGNVEFILDDVQNFDEDQPIYIYDNVTNQYHNLRWAPFQIYLPQGTYTERFSLRFTGAPLGTGTFTAPTHDIALTFATNDNMLTIENGKPEVNVQSVQIFDMLGQSLALWDVHAKDQSKMQILVPPISTGTYVVKALTTHGDISKKIIIK